jgi:hypothetical protein
VTYGVYSGPKGSQNVSPLEKSQALFKEFATLDDALSWAHHLEQTGRVPLLIEVMTARHWTVALSPPRCTWVCVSRSADSRRNEQDRLTREPRPLGTGAIRQPVPVGTYDVPVHHWPLGSRCGCGVVGVV